MWILIMCISASRYDSVIWASGSAPADRIIPYYFSLKTSREHNRRIWPIWATWLKNIAVCFGCERVHFLKNFVHVVAMNE